MKLRLFRIGETVVYLHICTLVSVGYMILLGQGRTMAIAMLSILIHESAHALTALLLGCKPCELEITPMGALMRLDEAMPITDGKRLLILLSGPIATGIICWSSLKLTQMGMLTQYQGAAFFAANAVILALNMLPSLPLDGGNLVFLLFRRMLPAHGASAVMRVISTLCGCFCIAACGWVSLQRGGWNLSLCFAGCVMIYAGAVCTRNNALHELKGFMDRRIRLEQSQTLRVCSRVLMPGYSLRKAVLLLHPRWYTVYLLLNTGLVPECVLTETDVIEAYLKFPGDVVHEARKDVASWESSTTLR